MSSQKQQLVAIVSDDKIIAIPGQSVLVDVAHDIESRRKAGDIVLTPTPTTNPNDPLNWSRTRKSTATGVVCLWAFLLGGATLSPTVTYGALQQQFQVDVNFLNIGGAIPLFCLGLFNVFYSPLSQKFGRRPVYLFSALLCAISQIVCAVARCKASWMVGRVLLGVGAAPFEQLPALSINDTFFIHQRGFGLSLYVLAITSGSFLGPVAAGFVVDSMGWRWVYGWFAIFLGSVMALIYVSLEETTFPRLTLDPSIQDPAADPARCQKKGFWAMRPLFVRNPTKESLGQLFWYPFRVIYLPIVAWCGFMYGCAVMWLSVMAVTLTTVFMSPEYHFTTASTGLTMLAPLVGSCLALYIGGAGTDRFMIWKARRNGGVMKSEARLYAIFIGGPVMASGLWLYGIGAAHNLNWVALVVGMALIGTGLPLSAELALSYSIEAYPLLASEVTVAVIFIRNTIGCAIVFGIAPWLEYCGLQTTFIVVGFMALFGMVSGVILIIYGQKFRERSSHLYWRLCGQLQRSF